MISDKISEYDLVMKFVRVGFDIEKSKEIAEKQKEVPNDFFLNYNPWKREFTWSDEYFLQQLVLNNA